VYHSNFLRLGRKGYTEVMANAMDNAAYLRQALEETGRVRTTPSNTHEPPTNDQP
jgi:glutamate/tyrosine decarboxylase-like PLP-dependent enzyme